MAKIDPPFHAQPVELPAQSVSLADSWNARTEQSAAPATPPISEWPIYAYAPDRWDPVTGPTKRDNESEESWLQRRYLSAHFWAKQDADAKPVAKGRPRLGTVDGETPADRRARQNREAQERYRLRKRVQVGANVGDEGLLRLYVIAQNEVTRLNAALYQAEARLSEIAALVDASRTANAGDSGSNTA